MVDYSDDEVCDLCGPFNESQHELSSKHNLNFLLLEYNKHRQSVAKDKNGIEITVSTKNVLAFEPLHIEINTKKGKYKSDLKESEVQTQQAGINFVFTIKATQPMYLLFCNKLHPYKGFTFTDMDGHLRNGSRPEFEAGAIYKVKLNCSAKDIGVYRMPIYFTFQTTDNKERFSIIKEMIINITSNLFENVPSEVKGKSPFTNQEWHDVYTEVPPAKKFYAVNKYPMPKEALLAYQSCLRFDGRYMSGRDKVMIDKINKYLEEKKPTPENFKYFFHHLLWLDEMGAVMKINHYNMENVMVTLTAHNPPFVVLKVPGLAEKRPSLIRSDEVKMRVHKGSVVYCGIIKEVQDQEIVIHQFCEQFINIIQCNPGETFDVQFEINRLVYERMHRAVDLCTLESKLEMLFPIQEKHKANTHRAYHITDSQFHDATIRNNREQKIAVINILNCSSGKVPYIVFGPPGTGKTVTIVEAIIQIVKKMPNSTVLVCAPANAACDMIALKLLPHFTKEELIRIHSETADWQIVPEEVKEYSNRTKDTCIKYGGPELRKFKIVVTTLMSAGRYVNAFTATHVFIDEAAQALEPEALIAVGGILKDNGQLVLAGDPKQLNPNCSSLGAEQRGLGVSLLERLMELPIYKNSNAESTYFITKLLQNYRNHPDILQLPNRFFYESELRAVSDYPINDPINKVVLIPGTPKNFVPQAVEFYGVNGKESREGRSPSYFNQKEVEVVLKYLNALTNPQAEVRVEPNEIGVVVPYIRQVYRIRGRIRDELTGVEVGTTETFQGREKRVMIISTVRAQTQLLLFDKKYNIGFVANPQRFNVAVTRAISKLIIVGNPQCLNNDKRWSAMIELCRSLKSYRGFYVKRDDNTREDIVKRFREVELKRIPQTTNNNANNRNPRRR